MSYYTKIVTIEGIKYKDCRKCGKVQLISEFHRRNLIPAGVRSICKTCRKQEKRHPENKESKAKYFQKNYLHIKGVHKNYWKKLKVAIYDKLGDHCVKCGFSDKRALQVDHINGNGNKTRREMTNYKFLKSLLEVSDEELFSNHQILCANCNQIKKIENNELKKQKERSHAEQ